MQTEKQDLIRNPEGEFLEPEEILDHPDLSSNQKLAALRCWQADLIELQKATEENMAGTDTGSGNTAARLSQVAAAIQRLEASDTG